jgi:hypothetical protein
MHVANSIARACMTAVLIAIIPVGCGPSTGGPESIEQFKIAQVGQIFSILRKGQKPPPQGIKDLVALKGALPAAISSVRSGDVVIYWGAGLSDDSEAASTVLAYQKQVPENGGEVLMQDGNPRKMTAAEFATAKKAGAANAGGTKTGEK